MTRMRVTDPAAHFSLVVVAAMVNAVTRLCLVPPIVVERVTDTAITFRTSQYTREANARILEALRDTLGSGFVLEWADKHTPRQVLHVSQIRP